MQGPQKTRVLSRAQIAEDTGLSANTVKITLSRLIASNVISRGHFSHSSTAGGTVFYPSKCVRDWCNLRDLDADKTSVEEEKLESKTRVQNGEDSGTDSDVSSSCYINNNKKQTVDDAQPKSQLDNLLALRKTLEDLQSRLNLDGLRLGLNDLLPIARDWNSNMGSFDESLEHIVFYVRSSEATGLTNPKAWLLKQLRTGYYGAPANFVSWEDQQVEAQMRSRHQQAERRKRVRMQSLEADFTLWLDTLATAERQAIFATQGDLKPEYISASMKMQMLRNRFADDNAVPEFAVIQQAEQGVV
jgi:hypothetical protein